jgi:hypothetical protein
VLRALRQLQGFRFRNNGSILGRVNDFYFEDDGWSVRHIVASVRERGSWKQVLIDPDRIEAVDLWDHQLVVALSDKELQNAPAANSVRPVCKQYENMGMATPGSIAFQCTAAKIDAHLRSAKAVFGYGVSTHGEDCGIVRDFVCDQNDWSIRYIQVEQHIDNRIILFHLLPNAVQRISWLASRIFLRELAPVQLEDTSTLLLPVLESSGTVAA